MAELARPFVGEYRERREIAQIDERFYFSVANASAVNKQNLQSGKLVKLTQHKPVSYMDDLDSMKEVHSKAV